MEFVAWQRKDLSIYVYHPSYNPNNKFIAMMYKPLSKEVKTFCRKAFQEKLRTYTQKVCCTYTQCNTLTLYSILIG